MNAKDFWSKVQKNETCWLWTKCKDKNGYGKYNHKRAHRVSYELVKGPIAFGMVIDHLCRNPSCVNPSHLEQVTPKENILRGRNYIAINTLKTHCKYGHEFTLENTYINPNNKGRHCRLCIKEVSRKKAITTRKQWVKKQKESEKLFEPIRKLASHCSKGHEYTSENTRYVFRKKTNLTVRQCRACDRERRRIHKDMDPSQYRNYRIIQNRTYIKE